MKKQRVSSLERALSLLPPKICIGEKNKACYFHSLFIRQWEHSNRVEMKSYAIRKGDYFEFPGWEIYYAMDNTPELFPKKYFTKYAHRFTNLKIYDDGTEEWFDAGDSLEKIAREVFKDITEKCVWHGSGSHNPKSWHYQVTSHKL